MLLLECGIITTMNLLEEISNSTLSPALREAVLGQLDALTEAAQSFRNQLAATQSALDAAQVKINALILELAHHRRIRFGVKNESLSAEQLSLFEEN